LPKGPARRRGDGVAHIILAVKDDGEPRLTQYWRIVGTEKAGNWPKKSKESGDA